MADLKEQEKLMLWGAVLRTIGFVLRGQPELWQPQEVPEHMREMLLNSTRQKSRKTRDRKLLGSPERHDGPDVDKTRSIDDSDRRVRRAPQVACDAEKAPFRRGLFSCGLRAGQDRAACGGSCLVLGRGQLRPLRAKSHSRRSQRAPRPIVPARFKVKG
jgi:hypothetical protein